MSLHGAFLVCSSWVPSLDSGCIVHLQRWNRGQCSPLTSHWLPSKSIPCCRLPRCSSLLSQLPSWRKRWHCWRECWWLRQGLELGRSRSPKRSKRWLSEIPTGSYARASRWRINYAQCRLLSLRTRLPSCSWGFPQSSVLLHARAATRCRTGSRRIHSGKIKPWCFVRLDLGLIFRRVCASSLQAYTGLRTCSLFCRWRCLARVSSEA